MVSFLNQIIMSKFFLQQFQLSEKEIINGIEHWNNIQIGVSLEIVMDSNKAVVKYSGDVLMTIPDNEEYRILRTLVNARYESALECYFCEVDKDKNFMKNPPKVAVFLKSISQGKEGKFKNFLLSNG